MRKVFGVRVGWIAVLALALLAPTGATALGQVPIGQLAPVGTEDCLAFGEPYDEIQLATSSGPSYVVPSPGGVLTSWSTTGGSKAGASMGMKVFRLVGGQTFQVVAADAPRPLIPNVINTFPVSIPVQAGDVIGQHLPASSETICGFETTSPGDLAGFEPGNVPVGGGLTFDSPDPEWRLNISATLLPPPVVSAISPASGSIKGAPVVISGANFSQVRSVTFGGVPAQSFSVGSEGQISATAPASSALTQVPVAVTTAAGAAAGAQLFSYEGCRVPKLKGRSLKAAKKRIRKGGCKVGKVKKQGEATAKTGKVSKQSPKPGKVLPPNAKVKVTLAG